MRTAIFVDGLTLFHNLDGRKIHFRVLLNWLLDGDDEVYAGYFNCVLNKKSKESFFSHVEKSGFDVNVKTPLFNKFNDEYTVYGIDVGIVIKVMENIDKFDKCIIVSGKHTFLPLCKKLQDEGKKVEIVGKKESIHKCFNEFDKRYLENFL